MDIGRSTRDKGVIGIIGHAGAGHVHSHSGFVQDDTAGFAVIACMLRRAFPVCTTVSSVEADIHSQTVTVRTQDGGTGVARTRRGITPYEATLSRLVIGLDAVYSQNAAFAAFGRVYGQGCLELPVALQTATCLAVINTFEKRYPGLLHTGPENMEGKVGRCIGAVVEFNSVPVSIMGILNANDGGLGPDEDLEGNIMLGAKGEVMKSLGLGALPTIILESKAYVPALCKGQEEDKFWVRINRDVDNRVVYDALIQGIKAGNWVTNFHYIGNVWLITTLGSCVLGLALGALTSGLYRLAAYEVDIFNKRFRDLQAARREKAESSQPDGKQS